MSECKYRRKDGFCLQDLEYIYKGYCVDGPCSCFEPQTNADQIRAMSDEELSRWIVDNIIEPGYYNCDIWYRLWLDWLKSPVKNGP